MMAAAFEVLDRASRAAPGLRVEVYVRESYRLRLTRAADGRSKASEGWERGWALRLRTSDDRLEGFAATSGGGGEVIQWLLEAARAALAPTSMTDAWRAERASLEESSADDAWPTLDEASRWLVRALDFLEDRLGDDAGPLRAFVESARTSEAIINDSGLRAARSRDKAWAMVMAKDPQIPDARERPRIVVARALTDLDAGAWAEDLDAVGSPARLSARRLSLPLILTPSAATGLVPWLVQALHGPESAVVPNVGVGWRPVDDPEDPAAVSGGGFDDVGFPTRRRALASDGTPLRLEGPGTYRRASFRDVPAPMASCIVMESPTIEPPGEACRVTSLRAVPIPDGDVMIEFDGARLSGGEPGETIRGARLRATPGELAAAFVGAVGRRRAAGWGLVTPRLILDGLTLEA